MYYNISYDIAAILILLVIAAGMNTVLYTESAGHKYAKGSVFTVRIPQKVTSVKPMGDFSLRQKEHISAAPGDITALRACGKRVLVVDDVNMNVLVFKGLLRGTEISIDSANSGAEAIAMTKNTKYDIIFMDHLMPEMDGIETFHRIRDDSGNINHDTPVVALTANAIVGMRASYLSEGFADYLTKPVEQKDLLTVTERQLKDHNED